MVTGWNWSLSSRLRKRALGSHRSVRLRAVGAALPVVVLAGLVGVPAVTSPAHAAAPTARSVLATLKVKPYAVVTGYTSARFGKAWADINKDLCDTRNDILWRDLGRTAMLAPHNRCVVARGSFHSFYTGRTIRYAAAHPATVSVDRVVTEQQAWRTGARSWTATKRLIFANDPLNLVTVDAATSRRRGNRDASTWTPATPALRCTYVARRIAVQAKYGLWVTAGERSAYAAVLARCPRQGVPTGGAALPRTSGRPGSTTPPGVNVPDPGSTINPSPRPAGSATPAPGAPVAPGTSSSPGTSGPVTTARPGTTTPARPGATATAAPAGPTPSATPSVGLDHRGDWTPDQTNAYFDPTTSSELRKAAAGALPGTVLTVGDGIYLSRLVLSANGTKEHPIVLRGSRKAVFSSGGVGSGTGLYITGDYWRVEGISMQHSQKGVLLDGSVGTVLDGIEVADIGNEGVHFRKDSTDCVLQNSYIHDTGKSHAGFGEGVYLGTAVSNWDKVTGSNVLPDRSDRNSVIGNRIQNTTAEGVDIKEGTTGGVVSGNTFLHSGFSGANFADSWIDVKGEGYTVTGNTGDLDGTAVGIQVHSIVYPNHHPLEGEQVPGSGEDETISGNTYLGGGSAD